MIFFLKVSGKPIEEIIYRIKNIPEDEHTLDLSGNGLGFRSKDDFKAMLKAIPKHIISLKLGSNSLGAYLGYKNCELIDILSALPRHITALDLSSNTLGQETTVANLIKFLKSLPKSLTTLNLNWNNMRDTTFRTKKTDGEMAEIATAVQENITQLEFFGNGIEIQNEVALSKFLDNFHSKMNIIKVDNRTVNLEDYRKKHENPILDSTSLRRFGIFYQPSQIKDFLTELQTSLIRGFVGFSK